MKRTTSLLLFLLVFASSFAQGKDTTSAAFKLGQKVGSYIPVVLLMGLAIFTIFYFLRKSRKS